MRFIWGGNREKRNTRLVFSLDVTPDCDKLAIMAADFFQVYLDGKFCAYGPERTAAGFARSLEMDLQGVRQIKIFVLAYNHPSYACDLQLPYFGAEIYANGKTAFSTQDFSCHEELCRVEEMPKFSAQRGSVEFYDYTNLNIKTLQTYEVNAPKVLSTGKDCCRYEKCEFSPLGEGVFHGFDFVKKLMWQEKPHLQYGMSAFDVQTKIVDRASAGEFYAYDYVLPVERTGFLQLEIEAFERTELYAVFEEILVDGKWTFRRDSCNDFLGMILDKGKRTFVSAEPYAVHYLKILTTANVKITPHLIAYENNKADCVRVEGDERFVKIFEAAKNTFRQNAVDIFTDCPGRERAGWLCDSYFMAITERLLTGENKIEKKFLENIILADTSADVPQGMVPKCFPSEHTAWLYIPNWAMWFILEVKSYFDRTGDRELVDRAKEKIYSVVDFFKKYFNEYTLLENLESWIFIEWSICNERAYTKGVNIPSNILYAYALESVSILYGDSQLADLSKKMRQAIVKLAFNGEFFIENLLRDENGNLTLCENHVSETCQYYALFMGLCPSETFKKKMVEEFGPLRTSAYPEVGRSNVFIGYYLRLFYLCDIGEYDTAAEEILEIFTVMAEQTGTLWEKVEATASCNHGFASTAAVFILRCLCGYETVKDGQPILKKDFKNSGKYLLKPYFTYQKDE